MRILIEDKRGMNEAQAKQVALTIREWLRRGYGSTDSFEVRVIE